MRNAARVEIMKFRRSPVPRVSTALMVVLIPALGLAMYTVAADGDAAGPLGAKASAFLVGPGWEGHLGVAGQIAAVAVFLGTGIGVAWVFGREHADRTFSSLFAHPVPRSAIALAKLAVLAVWIVFVALGVAVGSVAAGWAADVGSDGDAGPTSAGLRLFTVVCLAGLLGLTVAPVASIGRSYLVSIGALVVAIAVAQFAVLFGTGAWLPYAIPGLVAVDGAGGAPVPGLLQLALVPAFAAATSAATVRWWSTAEVS